MWRLQLFKSGGKCALGGVFNISEEEDVMAKKNQKVTGVISNLTEGQARRIKIEIIASKQQIAPKARGGFISGHEKNVGMIMTRICNKIGIGGS